MLQKCNERESDRKKEVKINKIKIKILRKNQDGKRNGLKK